MHNVWSLDALYIRGILPIALNIEQEGESRYLGSENTLRQFQQTKSQDDPQETYMPEVLTSKSREGRNRWHRGWYRANLHPHVHARVYHAQNYPASQPVVSPRGLS